jgi:hypothetical protein
VAGGRRGKDDRKQYTSDPLDSTIERRISKEGHAFSPALKSATPPTRFLLVTQGGERLRERKGR